MGVPSEPTESSIRTRVSLTNGTIGELERVWATTNADDKAHLVVDMRQTEFVEVVTLVYLVSRMTARERSDQHTSIRLPKSRAVRDFLRDWQWPEAIRDVVGSSFRSLVDPRDHGYFGERRHTPSSVSDRPTESSDAFLRTHAFPIQTFFSSSREFGTALAATQSARWQDKYVLTVLNRHLRGRGNRVSTHIVHEAITNAVRHPNASVVQTASHFATSAHGESEKAGHLTIAVWDDGDSIVKTLRGAIARVGTLTPVETPRLHRSFDIAGNGPTRGQTIHSSQPVTAETPDDLLLLSAVFPGVTSVPRVSGDALDSVRAEDEAFGLPGMGLYVLLNTIIDVFNGELAIRTDGWFANLKRASKTTTPEHRLPTIRAKFAHSNAPFLGNLLTIRLPMQGDSE